MKRLIYIRGPDPGRISSSGACLAGFGRPILSDYFTAMVRTYYSLHPKQPNQIVKCLIANVINKNAKKLERPLLNDCRREGNYSVQRIFTPWWQEDVVDKSIDTYLHEET